MKIPETLQNFLNFANNIPSTYSPKEVRVLAEKMAAAFALPKLSLPLIRDQCLEVSGQRIATRTYHPAPQKKLPLILFFHGGGHVSGSIETHDALCRRIALASHAVLVSVEYRLAPEFPYPTGLLDCVCVFLQRTLLLKEYKVNTNDVFLAGDSAGGNLAISVCHKMKELEDKAIKGLVLIYPSVDFTMKNESYLRNELGYLLTREKIKWYFDNYFRNNDDRVEASPLYFKHLELLPPCYIAVAELDSLYDEAISFTKKLKNLGVSVTLEKFKGMTHVFAQLELFFPQQVFHLVKSIGQFISQHKE